MDDNAWCAHCDRAILPKRTLVNIYPDAAPVPSPQHDSPRSKKQGTIRQRSGLVHGTGRVRPNGTIKAAPVKTRVEIDQSPAPLYCSDECRQRDTEFFHGRPAYSDSASSDTSDDQDDSGLRTARHSRHLSYDLDASHSRERSTPNTRSLAVLQREYNMAPLPPPTCETYDEHAPRSRQARPPYTPPAYTSGVMMAHKRIDAVLPKPLKPGERPPPLKPVPGWTDGSQAWRASTYSFAPPPKTRADVLDPSRKAYETCVASPHRSAQSGVSASSSSAGASSSSGGYSSAPTSPTSVTTASSSSLNSELLSSFEDSFARRTSSRLSLASSPSSSYTSSGSPPRARQMKSHLAASKLLVPDVLLRPSPPKPTLSSDSLSALPTSERAARAARRHSSGSFGAQRRVRSPLSLTSNSHSGSSESADADERDETAVEAEDAEEAAYVKKCSGDHTPRRPYVETRSWSYDNVRTYPVMALPAVKETRIVDGVETEVEVPRVMKRLFTFAPIPVV